ncbi:MULTISPECIES: fimbrial protein [Pseudomonas]|uniref:fimbrial protein n=1 Tax=Pseudomonas nitroreducens TaxID=46680 RepID=UPI001E3C9D3F|nr:MULTISPECIES: fimbrial protein [Pseudomonas]MCE4072670.1 type 1 fimbrial protein [Pseudomonas nitritireducens]MCE4082151.1 type 1 fimbrial protein [Pseudomonas nitroreducens]
MKAYMKKLAALAIIAAPGFAAAADTITFNGEVTDQTCAVTINGTTGNATVMLPTVSAADLSDANSTAGSTPFTLGVSGCSTTGAQSIKAKFLGHSVDGNGNLSNIAASNPATNVALQLQEAVGGAVISLNGVTSATTGIDLAGATSGSHDYAVQYVSVPGAATAGLVTGVTEYTVTYQ